MNSLLAITLALLLQSSSSTSTLENEELAGLQLLARNPRAEIVMPTEAEQPFANHQKEFDAAMASVRQALSPERRDANVYANLALLYFWRDFLTDGRPSGINRSIDYFVSALAADPTHRATLTYLGRSQILRAYREYVDSPDLNKIETALHQAAAKAPANPNVPIVLIRWLTGQPLRTRDALATAEQAARDFPQSADLWIALGALQLRSGDASKASGSLRKALDLGSGQRESAVAWLGSASARLAQNDLAGADDALGRARGAGFSPTALNAAAYELGMDAADAIGWRLGKAYIARGDIDKAVRLVGAIGLQWLASQEGTTKNNEGVRLFDQHNLPAARAALLAAAELDPASPQIWRNLATVAFDMGRYGEVGRALQRLSRFGSLADWEHNRFALSSAVAGDYEAALERATQGTKAFPGHAALAGWRVVYTYAAGGWNNTEILWAQTHGVAGGRLPRNESLAMFDLVDRGLADLANRSERAGIRYGTLTHLSLRFRALGSPILTSSDETQWAREEREAVLAKIVELYRQVPVKPAVPDEALRLSAEGARHVDRGEWADAMQSYRQGLELAPWWPEGRFNLGLAARAAPQWALLSPADEMRRCMALAPGTPIAKRAEDKLKQWETESNELDRVRRQR